MNEKSLPEEKLENVSGGFDLNPLPGRMIDVHEALRCPHFTVSSTARTDSTLCYNCNYVFIKQVDSGPLTGTFYFCQKK
ncbi:MAG: hypothetical protein LBL98_08025 [Ruminococcus sp.]|jgi:hypothetical protein|nr:hypothetical protein [Ruminococcus sp.]